MNRVYRALIEIAALLLLLSACFSPATQTSLDKEDMVVSVKESEVPKQAEEPAKEEIKLESESESKPKPESEPELSPAEENEFLPEVEMGVIDAINEERERLGLGTLEYNERLCLAARIRSRELYESDTFAHERPDGEPFETVLQKDIPTAYLSAGENLAYVEFSDPNACYHEDAYFWYSEWESSPPHYENICRENFNSIGVGIFYTYEGKTTIAYATTIFAKL